MYILTTMSLKHLHLLQPPNIGDIMKPKSCNTFVVLPPATSNDSTIFGKNSNRPSSEVQEVIYLPAADHPKGTTVQVRHPLLLSHH